MSYIVIALTCLLVGAIAGYFVGRKNPSAADRALAIVNRKP